MQVYFDSQILYILFEVWSNNQQIKSFFPSGFCKLDSLFFFPFFSIILWFNNMPCYLYILYFVQTYFLKLPPTANKGSVKKYFLPLKYFSNTSLSENFVKFCLIYLEDKQHQKFQVSIFKWEFSAVVGSWDDKRDVEFIRVISNPPLHHLCWEPRSATWILQIPWSRSTLFCGWSI